MPELNEITAIESNYSRLDGEPTLGTAYAMLETRWLAGKRDLETGLRLLFLAWYACAEPPWLTGLPTQENTQAVFREVFSHLGGTASTETELLYVVGRLSDSFPYCCGDELEWAALGLLCKQRAHELRPEGFRPEHFEGRGAYGEYFAHLARSEAGLQNE